MMGQNLQNQCESLLPLLVGTGLGKLSLASVCHANWGQRALCP